MPPEMKVTQAEPQPTKPGFYWALWTVAEPGTHEGDDLTPAKGWEVVEVWENHIGTECEADKENGIEKFRVSVPGVRESQTLDCFLWGKAVLQSPPPMTESQRREFVERCEQIHKLPKFSDRATKRGELAAELAQHCPAIAAAGGWRPIAEAPKDCRPLLLWYPDGPEDAACMRVDCERTYRKERWWPGINGVKPTHWQPLPSIPARLPTPGDAETNGGK